MASTYINNLRLNELGTGDASGTWGTVTNLNLELVGEALGNNNEGLSDSATHTSTVSDGASATPRSLYLTYTGTLSQQCTITLAPNDVKIVKIIKNGTSGSQNIVMKQGSGATISIAPGETKILSFDGAGASAAVSEATNGVSMGSVAMTGTPTAPTAGANTNTTQVASTAFVQQELGHIVVIEQVSAGDPVAGDFTNGAIFVGQY